MRCDNCGREGLEEVISDSKGRLFCGEECKVALNTEGAKANNHENMVTGDHARALEIVDKYRIMGEENRNHLKMHLDMLWKERKEFKAEKEAN